MLWIGGSNAIGEPTTGAPTVAKPANVTSRFLVAGVGTNVADWSTLTQHGCDVYIADYWRNTMGYTSPILMCNHGVATTSAGTWESTYAAAAVTSWNVLSPAAPPNIICIASGGQDASGAGAYNAFDQDTLDFWAVFAAAFGAGFARVITETPAPQADFPFADLLRIKQANQARDANDCSIFIDTFDSLTQLSRYALIDTQHRNAAGNKALGAAIAPQLYSLLP